MSRFAAVLLYKVIIVRGCETCARHGHSNLKKSANMSIKQCVVNPKFMAKIILEITVGMEGSKR